MSVRWHEDAAPRASGDGAVGARRVLTGWGRRPRSAALVVPSGMWRDVVAADRGILARGLGRSYGDAGLNAGGTVVDMTDAARLLAFDPDRGLVHAEAGMSFADLLRACLPYGWFPSVTPGTRHVTLGGALASDVHGKNHHVDGSFARHVERFGLLVPGSERRDVVTGDEEFTATAGGMGLTGIVTDLTVRMRRVGSAWMRVRTERTTGLDETMARMAVLDRGARYAVAWVDLLAGGRALGRGVITTGDHADPDDVPDHAGGRPLAATHDARFTMPPVVPSGGLNPAAVRAFNEIYWRRAPRTARTRPESIGAFFYPLDVVDRWNRGYGPAGFVQYQFVVPVGAEETLRNIVAGLSRARCPSYLAVLKRFGAGGGMLSFPVEGWTLALDVPAGVAGLPRLLDGFDEDVAAAGGRVYLAKDGRMRPEVIAAMYPELDRWRQVRTRLDPDRRSRSDLARRLHLLDG